VSKTSILLSLLLHATALTVLARLDFSPASGPDTASGSGGEGGGGLVIGIRPPGAPFPAPTAPAEHEVPPAPEEGFPGAPAQPPPEPGPEPPSEAELPAVGDALTEAFAKSAEAEAEPMPANALQGEATPAAGLASAQPAAEPPLTLPFPLIEPAPPRARQPEAESSSPGVASAASVPGLEGAGLAESGSLRAGYPASCRRLGHQGVVVVRLIVGADGKVRHAEVTRGAGCPELDRAALEAVLCARFRAARRWGRPVESTLEQPFRFKLTGR